MSRRINVADARRRFAGKPRAQVLVLISTAMVVLMGMAALAVDVGDLWTTYRRMQNAADAAAMAGVDALTVGETGSAVTSAAQNAASQNGFTNGSTTITSTSLVSVTVNNPPTSGFYTGLPTAVQVVVAQKQPTYFMRVLGWKQVPVSTTATALAVGSGSCIFSLDSSSSVVGIDVGGTSTLNSTCGVYDNSSSTSAYTVAGGGTVNAPFVGVAGGTSISGGGSTPVTTSIPHFGDPLSWVQEPSPTSYSCSAYKTQSPTGSVPPQTFCGGIHITAGTSVSFQPGLYVIDGGGIQIDGGATVSGTGVTFFLTGANKAASSPQDYGGVNINSSATVNLSAPCDASSGGITGMLFFQDRNITTGVGSTINGSSSSTFDGAIYFPTTALSYSGSTSSGGYTLLVADTVTIVGTANLGNNEATCPDPSTGPMIKDAVLAE